MKLASAVFVAPMTCLVAVLLVGAPMAQASVAKVVPDTIKVSAIPSVEDKAFASVASLCLTTAMKTLHASTVKQMKADIDKKGKGHDEAVEIYQDKVLMIWSAMEQPYCGFGSLGMAAVKHSYLKSVDRTRAEFLAAVK